MAEFARPSSGGAPPSSGAAEVAIVGAGRVGCAIGRALASRGHRIVAASTRSDASAARVRAILGDVPLMAAEDAAIAADIIVIAVPDDALEDVARRVAAGMRPGATVVHTSGIHGTSVLAPCGERVAAVHPAQSIASPDADLTGAWLGITCPDAMREWAEWFTGQLGGIALHVAEEDRARYHAALSMASNFTVALAGDAGDLLPDRRMLGPLLRQTLQNVIDLGPDRALTGPVVRGDAGTIRAHLDALPADLQPAYVANARRTLQRARAAGRLDADAAAAVEAALQEALVP